MWRFALIVLGTAAAGSLAGTLVLGLLAGGTGSPDQVGSVLSFSRFTMVFTVPGAIMLVGLQAMLLERGFSRPITSVLIILAGGVAGGLVLGFLSLALASVSVGALYGTLTAIAFILLQMLPGLSPEAAR